MPKFFESLKNFYLGTPEKRENVLNLAPEQEGLYKQLLSAGKGKGAGGVFGQTADYYRNLLSGQGEDYDAMMNPELRRYYEDIIPSLSEQFAGLGSGGLSSSGFRNAQMQGATDLSERLAAMRANLRQQGAQGLMGLGQLGLQNYSQNMTTQQGSPGFLASLAPLIGTAAGMYIGGPPGAAIGGNLGQNFGQSLNQTFGTTSPYGNQGPQSSLGFSNPSQGFSLPKFLQ